MRVFGFLLAASVLMACSGATVGISDGPGGGGGDAGGGGGDGGTGDGSPGPGCSTKSDQLTRACLPGVAQAGAAVEIEMAWEGCLGCGDSNPRCDVQVSGTTITVGLRYTSCPVTGPCPAMCAQPLAKCKLPALSAGTYSVQLESVNRPSVTRQLVVEAQGATSCKLSHGDPPPVDPSQYDHKCASVSDCALVALASCSPCSCPGTAIAKSDLDRYTADRRAFESSCDWSGGVACAGACRQLQLACEANTCVAK